MKDALDEPDEVRRLRSVAGKLPGEGGGEGSGVGVLGMGSMESVGLDGARAVAVEAMGEEGLPTGR